MTRALVILGLLASPALACPAPETCPANFAWVGNSAQCATSDNIVPAEFDEPNRLCFGVRNPHMAAIRANWAAKQAWMKSHPGCQCGAATYGYEY